MTLKEKLAEFEKILHKETQGFYRDRLISLVIFWSIARGTYQNDSYFDILRILEELANGRMRRMAEFMEVEKRLEPELIS